MTIFAALMVLLLTLLVTTITHLYDLTIGHHSNTHIDTEHEYEYYDIFRKAGRGQD